jgi:hypothetical protein
MKVNKEKGNEPQDVRISRITVKKKAGFHVSREGDFLVIVLPFIEPRPSSTGRTNLIASTGGPCATFAEFGGRSIMVSAVAMVKVDGPDWRVRLHALLARWNGRIS